MYEDDENEYGYQRYHCRACRTSFYSDTTPNGCENCGAGAKDEDEDEARDEDDDTNAEDETEAARTLQGQIDLAGVVWEILTGVERMKS